MNGISAISLRINTSFHGKTVISLLIGNHIAPLKEYEIETKRDFRAMKAAGVKKL